MRATIAALIFVGLAGISATPQAHVPPECLKWLQQAAEKMTRLGNQTGAMSEALQRYYEEGEIWPYLDLTAQAMGTVQHGYLAMLEGFECSHPGLIPPAALDAIRAEAGLGN